MASLHWVGDNTASYVTCTTSSAMPTFSNWWIDNGGTASATAMTSGTVYYPIYVPPTMTTSASTTIGTSSTIWPIIWSSSGNAPVYQPAQTIIHPSHVYVPSVHNSRRNRRLSREEREAAERAEREQQRQMQEQQQRLTELRERQKEAKERAKALLMMHLSEDQQRELHEHGWFIVRGGNSGQEYRIIAKNDNFAGNVHVLGEGRRVLHRLCAHCNHDIPFGDQILAQKVMLESCEHEFLRIANRSAA